MFVKKASGEREEFDINKVKRTCLRAGASEKLAERIAREVGSKAYEGMSTREILGLTLELLKEEPHAATRYDLKRAIFSLGPAGFNFEEYVAEILRQNGYAATVGQILEGKCVHQEVDIVAERDGQRFMIECKYHNSPGISTDLQVAMYTHARFLDLREEFDRGWLVSNTKCTLVARKYAECVGLRLTSWRYPEESLERLIEEKKLYPVTILKSISGPSRDKLFEAKVILARDLVKYSTAELVRLTGVSTDEANKILDEAMLVR